MHARSTCLGVLIFTTSLLVGCFSEDRIAKPLGDSVVKDPVPVTERMRAELELEYGQLPAAKTAASKRGDVGYVKGSTSCVSGEEVRFLIDEEDYKIGAQTQQDYSAGLQEQFNTSRIRWAHRGMNRNQYYECGSMDDARNNNESAFGCMPGLGLQGFRRYRAYPAHNAGLDTELKFCKDFITYAQPAKYGYALLALHRNTQEEACGCPFPTQMFSVDYPTDKSSASLAVGPVGPNMVSSSPKDFVRLYFCYREGTGTYFWNPWEDTGRLGKVGVVSGGNNHAEPWDPYRDQVGASEYQMVWEFHPNDPQFDPQVNHNIIFTFYDCMGVNYWNSTRRNDVRINLFTVRPNPPPGRINDFMMHVTWRGP